MSVLDGKPLGAASSLTKYNRYDGQTLAIEAPPFANNAETFKTVFKHP